MLRRFAAASLIPSCLIAIGGVALIAFRLLANQRYYQMAVLWCLVPVVWGLWAMVMPKTWFPQKLFAWGAILGVVAYVMGALVINVPLRVAGIVLPMWAKIAGFVIAPVVYGGLWMLIGPVYRALSPDETPARVHGRAA